MLNYNYDVEILINDEKPLRKYAYDNKIFVEARNDTEYSIKVKNNSFGRILVVASVDGLDVLSGETAQENSSGYIVNGYDVLRIKGFRRSNDSVGAFKFTTKNRSYAADKGNNAQANCGVIGIRIYDEYIRPIITNTWITHDWDYPWIKPWRQPYPWEYPLIGGYNNGGGCGSTSSTTFNANATKTSYTCNADSGININAMGCFNSADVSSRSVKSTLSDNTCRSYQPAQAKAPEFDLGTSWGREKTDHVTSVSFERGNMVSDIDIYYASKDALIDMGVPVVRETQVTYPKSFGGFAKPPTGWRG